MYKAIEVKLTREEAIKLHKEMWNYILEEEKKLGRSYPLRALAYINCRALLKAEWLKLHNYGGVRNNCFLCEYAFAKGTSCTNCPGKWDTSGYIACEGLNDSSLRWTTADPAYIRDICD